MLILLRFLIGFHLWKPMPLSSFFLLRVLSNTSMVEPISFARRLASSSMSLPSFKVFSVCRLPLSIASFFFCKYRINKISKHFWVKPYPVLYSWLPWAIWTKVLQTSHVVMWTVRLDENNRNYSASPPRVILFKCLHSFFLHLTVRKSSKKRKVIWWQLRN